MNSKIKSPVKLYPNGPAENNGITKTESFENNSIFNVSEALLTIYYPRTTNTGVSVLICPGGGYIKEAIFHEGYQYAEWLSQQGITAFVLKYRLPNEHKNVPLADVRQAMKFIREHASELNIDSNKIGISGFSAGGHLAATAGVKLTEADVQPNFMILFYPVISMTDNLTHMGSRTNLLGKNPKKQDIDAFSAEKNITTQTPPTILFLSDDDKTVNPLNSILFYKGLKEKNIPASINIYPIGKHGWGFHTYFEYHELWKTQLMKLLIQMKFI